MYETRLPLRLQSKETKLIHYGFMHLRRTC